MNSDNMLARQGIDDWSYSHLFNPVLSFLIKTISPLLSPAWANFRTWPEMFIRVALSVVNLMTRSNSGMILAEAEHG